MPKKSKRSVHKEINPIIEIPIADPLVSNRPTGFNPDYSYVYKDLRRVGILAGIFIITLIVLSFLLK